MPATSGPTPVLPSTPTRTPPTRPRPRRPGRSSRAIYSLPDTSPRTPLRKRPSAPARRTSPTSSRPAPAGCSARSAISGWTSGLPPTPSGQKGMRIVNILPGSTAERAGLQVGDIIFSGNGYVTEQARSTSAGSSPTRRPTTVLQADRPQGERRPRSRPSRSHAVIEPRSRALEAPAARLPRAAGASPPVSPAKSSTQTRQQSKMIRGWIAADARGFDNAGWGRRSIATRTIKAGGPRRPSDRRGRRSSARA